mgnify:CR=1 FL=1
MRSSNTEPLVGHLNVALVPAGPVAALVAGDEQDCAAFGIEGNRIRISERPADPGRVDTLRRYAEALGGKLRLEVQVGDDTFQIA